MLNYQRVDPSRAKVLTRPAQRDLIQSLKPLFNLSSCMFQPIIRVAACSSVRMLLPHVGPILDALTIIPVLEWIQHHSSS